MKAAPPPGLGRPAPPGLHGGDGAAVAASLGMDPSRLLDLSASLNPLAPDPTPALVRHAGALRRYPDPLPATEALAAAIGAPATSILLTNGGSEAIALVAADVGTGWVEEPDFSLYRRHLRRVEPGAPVFRSNPRNPTGELAPDAAEAAVWDEAFYPLAAGRWTRGDAERGSVVVGSLTKLLACPGLRLGYVMSHDENLLRRLAERQPRWSVNGLCTSALPEMLASVDLAAWSTELARLRGRLGGLLRSFGLEPRPSSACFVVVDEAAGLRDRLAPLGVLVRDCASFGMPGSARIAVPDDSGLCRLGAALDRAARREGQLS